ncbi:MAG: metallophosphoesterase [Planctomycetota bacterium]|nr:MAG: metallophosphoesterase [Planctomycetota bacterium]
MTRRIALISDIHANLVALEAVLADIAQANIDAIYCLGDLVGYGPQPIEVVDRVMQVAAPGKAIVGNHDYAIFEEPIGFNRSAREAVDWTREVMQPRWYQWGTVKRRWHWLRQLPTVLEEEDVMFVHASPRQHLEEYILEEHTQGMSHSGEDPEVMLEENFQLVKHLCFIGHTHRPGVLTHDFQWIKPAECDNHWTAPKEKAIINIGSVGQPRDRDARGCYAIFDGSSVEWRRVAYDIDAVKALIEANPRLDNRLADRLYHGK